MKDDLQIRESNWQVHRDLDLDILAKRKQFFFSFVLRVNNGEICDYIILENARYTINQVSQNS